MSGVPVPATLDGLNYNAADITEWKADADAWLAACITGAPVAVGTVTPVNVSFFSGFTNKTFPSGRTRPVPTPRVTPLIDPIIGSDVNPKVATQRRRNQQST
jgi:hypothetical protein